MMRGGISKKLALETLKNPEKVIEGKYSGKIAQKVFGGFFLRVIFEEHGNIGYVKMAGGFCD